MTTGERRAVVTNVRGRYDVSERQACRMLGFERSMVRFVPQRPVIDALDQLSSGRRFRTLTLIDSCTRESSLQGPRDGPASRPSSPYLQAHLSGLSCPRGIRR